MPARDAAIFLRYGPHHAQDLREREKPARRLGTVEVLLHLHSGI
ncbi:MAG TPA: hypothetical protein VEX18_22235 [Polyangiaceae bacterium]|nr:hypothetical protein [Polyangiaceae bacterium]